MQTGTKLFEQYVVTSLSPDGAIGAAYKHGSRTVKPPIFVAKTLAKIAGGAVADLTDAERHHLQTLGIGIERVDPTDADRNRILADGIAAGHDPAVAGIAAMSARAGWRSTEKVELQTYFKPA